MTEAANVGARLAAPVHPIDPDALAAYLRATVAPFPGTPGIEQFQGGQSNPTYRITAGDRRFVLPLPPRHVPGPSGGGKLPVSGTRSGWAGGLSSYRRGPADGFRGAWRPPGGTRQ